MATLTVWKYDSDSGAETALGKLLDLQKHELIAVLDAATVSWPAGKKKPKTRQLHELAGPAALGGAFWGLLFGIIFFVPILGMAAGAAIAALTGALTDIGIDDDFIAKTRSEVTPGTSALFLLSQDEVAERVSKEMSGTVGHLIASNLTAEQETQLREVFAEDS